MFTHPSTAEQMRLSDLFDTQDGQVIHLGPAFARSERPTNVDVSIVALRKIADDDRLDLWKSDTQEPDAPSDQPEQQFLAKPDRLGNMEHYFNQANKHMYKAMQHLRRAAVFIEANGIKVTEDYRTIGGLGFQNFNNAMAEFTRKHRRDAWISVFEKMEFRKWLDKKQTEEFLRDVERNGKVPFTADNIKGTLQNVVLQRAKLFEKSVANVFDELCRYYKGNGNHGEGWKSNSSYKVNEKLVFPYGCQFDSKYCRYFSLRYGNQIDIYRDLDRILCVLAGVKFEECRCIDQALDERFKELGHGVSGHFDNKVVSQFFEIRFWMKGTIHLRFRDRKLWEKFNVTASAGKKWIGGAD